MMPFDPDRYVSFSDDPGYLIRIEAAEKYAGKLLPFIPRGLPVYQSHGVTHSLAIISFINQITRYPGILLTTPELFLLSLSAWFHDIGYLHPHSLIDRHQHPCLSAAMVHKDPVIHDLLRPDELSILEIIIRNHDSRTDLSQIRESSDPVRIPLLAAVFRLVDAIDIGTDRCPPEVFALIEDGLDDHSKRHWQAHQNVLGCLVVYPEIKILVRDPDNPFFRRRIVTHLEDDCHSCGRIFQMYGVKPPVLVIRTAESHGL
jgi:hypothetical protein